MNSQEQAQGAAPRPIDIVTRRFKKACEPENRRHKVMECWDDMDIYCKPMSQVSMSKALERAEGKGGWFFPALISVMAEDVNGKPLFTMPEIVQLAEQAFSDEITELATWIESDTEVSDARVEEARKN